MHLLARSALLGVLLASYGCAQECDLSAHGSVSLLIVDAETGEPIEIGLRVTFTVDGGEPEEAENQGRGRYLTAYETPGHFEVTVGGDGYETVVTEYDVADGECHVEGVFDEIELVPVPDGAMG